MTTHPQDEPRRLARFARIALAVVLLTQVAGLLLSLHREGTAVGTWIFLELRWAEATSILIERACSVVALLGCLMAIFARSSNARVVGAGIASTWFAALALAEWRMGGAPFTELALAAHATRIAAPMVLAAWDRVRVMRWILRVSVAATFMVHGFESLNLHPGFVDYLLAADLRLFGLGLEPGRSGDHPPLHRRP